MTNKTAAMEYQKLSEGLAKVISEVSEIMNNAQKLSEVCHDAGDPYYGLEEVVKKLGTVLADAVIYAKEYREEKPDASIDAG